MKKVVKNQKSKGIVKIFEKSFDVSIKEILMKHNCQEMWKMLEIIPMNT